MIVKCPLSDDVIGSDLSESQKADVTSQTDIQRLSSESEKLNLADEDFDSDSGKKIFKTIYHYLKHRTCQLHNIPALLV